MISFEQNEFTSNLQIDKDDEDIIFNWTKEIGDYRLHDHFERKTKN